MEQCFVFGIPISLLMLVRMFVFHLIIIIKSDLFIITHFLGLGYDAVVNVVCLPMLLWYFVFKYLSWWTNHFIRLRLRLSGHLIFRILVRNDDLRCISISTHCWFDYFLLIKKTHTKEKKQVANFKTVMTNFGTWYGIARLHWVIAGNTSQHPNRLTSSKLTLSAVSTTVIV